MGPFLSHRFFRASDIGEVSAEKIVSGLQGSGGLFDESAVGGLGKVGASPGKQQYTQFAFVSGHNLTLVFIRHDSPVGPLSGLVRVRGR
ncbi:hypothetical protein D3C84_603300 [compost metagenome]